MKTLNNFTKEILNQKKMKCVTGGSETGQTQQSSSGSGGMGAGAHANGSLVVFGQPTQSPHALAHEGSHVKQSGHGTPTSF